MLFRSRFVKVARSLNPMLSLPKPAPLSPEARQLLQLAPGPRQVQGVGSLVRPVSNTTVANTSNNTFHVTTSDPRLAARETLRLFNEQQRRERDAAHPEPAEE